MKYSRKVFLLLCVLCLASVLLCLSACKSEADTENNTALAEQFMDHVIANDYDAAYGMVKATVADPDFREYWISIQAAAEGATACELEQVSGQLSKAGGEVDRTAGYKASLDNGRTVYLRVMTREGIEGIAGIHFSDVTDFLKKAEPVVPKISIALQILYFVFLGFTLWMFVDCLRRKLRYKLVWLILIVMNLVLTITVGEASDLAFRVSFWFARGTVSTIDIELGQVAVVTKLVIPVGALLYLCLRKHFAVEKPAPENQTPETEQV